MKYFIGVFFLVFILAGCSSELTFKEMELKNVKKDVYTFFENVEENNGAHLFFDGDKVVYIMLNGANVELDEKAIYFTDFEVTSEGETLNIHYGEEETENFTDKSLRHQVVYKISKDKQYETIRVFKNGNEAFFHTVSGN